MLTSKSLAVSLISLLIAFNSRIALAADERFTDSLPPIWPLILILGVIFIFRKQLNCVPPIDISEPHREVKVELEPTQEEAPASQEAIAPEANLESDTIDLKDNSNQCQASTAKGTRCKRKNTLEAASVNIDGIVYLLTACAQHNNNSLRPYSGLTNNINT